MRKVWVAMPLVILLGSSVLPAHRLGYDLTALIGYAELCGEGGDCVGVPAGSAPPVRDARVASLAPPEQRVRPVPRGARAEPASPPAAAPPIAPAAPAAPESWPADAVRLVVSLPQQRLFVLRGSALIASTPVSTGKRGHGTPAGTFHITEKQVHHRSNRYSNAPMPFMQRITNSGIALHAGHLPGYPASHGCIRMPWPFAKTLYSLTTYGTPVTIIRDRFGGGEMMAAAAPAPLPVVHRASEPREVAAIAPVEPDPLAEDYVSWRR